jgi:hypothetical protein
MKKAHFCDVVLMLVRENPGLTRGQIGEEAASWKLMWSLLPGKPLAARALFGERLDLTKPIADGAERAVNDAYSYDYVQEDDEGRFRITHLGQAWLREKSGL